jgi:hypothetical protein
VTAEGDAGANAAQLDTGWRGYFTGSPVHIRNEERAVSIVRWFAQHQQRLSAWGRRRGSSLAGPMVTSAG